MQGRIEQGTLFSNISMAISEGMEAEVEAGFNTVQKEVANIFVLTETDIRMGLGMDDQHCEKGDTSREDTERRKEGLACELRDLKRQHEEVSASIDSIQRGAPHTREYEEESCVL